MILFISILVCVALVTLLSTGKIWDNDEIGVKKITGTGKILVLFSLLAIVLSIIQFVTNEKALKLKEEATEINQFKRDSTLISEYGYMLDTTSKKLININKSDNLKEAILNWDKKDERIRNIYRIVKTPLDIVFPYGYKIFATNPKTFLIENDTIFSNILASGLNEKVYFDYSNNKVHIEVEENIVYRFNKKYTQRGNIYVNDINIPPPGYYTQIGGVQINEVNLYFAVLDNTRNDEIYLFGYKKLGQPKEFTNYHPHD